MILLKLKGEREWNLVSEFIFFFQIKVKSLSQLPPLELSCGDVIRLLAVFLEVGKKHNLGALFYVE